ncbi:MAG: PPC domain-containing protein, partial [Phycisphaerae bacterium]|nr:PPC domain-containing protein [Phycisphaerae bacterium]
VTGSILPKGDHDWYAFEVGSQGEYEFAITDVPLELDMHARVYNAEGNAISGWLAPLRAGGEMRGKVNIPEPGHYFVEVVDGNDDARSIDTYTLTITPASGATP